MKYFFSNKVRIALIVAAILAAALAIASSLTSLTPGEFIVQGILTPMRATVSSAASQIAQFYDYIYRYEELAAENEELKAQIAEMEDDVRDLSDLERENERLRALLELVEDNDDYTLVDCYVITRSSNDWTSTVTVNKGTSSGIEAGMCAITANGEVVGLVTETGSNYSIIKTVLDSSLEISATIASSGYSGSVQGGYTTETAGKLRMDYLPSSAVIRNNDQVVTSGTTVYPRNLILGYIIDAGFDDTGVAKYAILEPAVDLESLEQVFILTGFDED